MKDNSNMKADAHSVCSQSVTLDLQMQTGSSPDQLWSCWQIRTEEPMSLNPGLHW